VGELGWSERSITVFVVMGVATHFFGSSAFSRIARGESTVIVVPFVTATSVCEQSRADEVSVKHTFFRNILPKEPFSRCPPISGWVEPESSTVSLLLAEDDFGKGRRDGMVSLVTKDGSFIAQWVSWKGGADINMGLLGGARTFSVRLGMSDGMFLYLSKNNRRNIAKRPTTVF
jgi:hypothetical protein